MLATRLKRVMQKLVGQAQSGLMEDRHLTDSILLVNEVYASLKAGQVSGMILQLEFKKAFDSVDWSFLFHLLRASPGVS